MLGLDQVHLVHETEDVGVGTELAEGLDDGIIGVEVAVYLSGFNVEDVDEHRDVGEDVAALGCEVCFHESILSIPRSRLAKGIAM